MPLTHKRCFIHCCKYICKKAASWLIQGNLLKGREWLKVKYWKNLFADQRKNSLVICNNFFHYYKKHTSKLVKLYFLCFQSCFQAFWSFPLYEISLDSWYLKSIFGNLHLCVHSTTKQGGEGGVRKKTINAVNMCLFTKTVKILNVLKRILLSSWKVKKLDN